LKPKLKPTPNQTLADAELTNEDSETETPISYEQTTSETITNSTQEDIPSKPRYPEAYLPEPMYSDFPHDHMVITKIVDIPPDLLLEMKRVKWPKGSLRLYPEVMTMMRVDDWENIEKNYPIPETRKNPNPFDIGKLDQ